MCNLRKSPIYHTVKKHKRMGVWVESFERGRGQSHKRKSKVVRPHRLNYSDAEAVIDIWVRNMPQQDNPEYIYHTTFSELGPIKREGLVPFGEQTFPGYGKSLIYWSPDLNAARYWSEMGFWRMYDRGTITEPTLLRARREGVPNLRTTIRKDELASSSIPPSALEFWDLQSHVWRKLT